MEIVIVILSIIIIIELLLKIKQKKEYKELFNKFQYISNENQLLKSENENLKEELLTTKEEVKLLQKENSEYKAKISSLQTELEKIKEFQKEKEELLTKKFEEISKNVIDHSQKNTLSTILEPLKSEINQFKNRLETLSKEEAQEISALMNELNNIKVLNQTLSQEAQNLVNALKNNKKIQGMWGEITLRKLLEISGLKEEIDFKIEVSRENKRPDVVIFLPDNKEIIIDAKTSLNAYVEYIKTEDKKYIDELTKNIETHIKQLSKKEYEKLSNTIEFIIMFIPIDNALSLVLENKPSLFEESIKQKILLTSPTTLIATLKVIEYSLRYKHQIENIDEIVKISENLYSKIANFIEEFLKIGKNLDTAQKSYDSALKKLQGQGNMLTLSKKLKEKAKIFPKKEIKV